MIPILLALGVVDYWIRFEDRGLRWLWSLAAGATVVWAAVRYLLPAVRQRLDRVGLARRIDEHFHGGATTDQIASAIEFLGEDERDPLAGSPALRQAAVAQAQARLGDADWSAVVDRRPALRAAALAAALLAVALGVCLWRPADARLAIVRLANPLGNAAWPPVNDLAFRHRVERVAVGQPFEVELIDRNRRLPEDVQIEYRTADADGGRQTERRPMQLIGDMAVARRENVSQAFDYRAEGGDDHRMAWTHVELVEPPRIKDLHITLHPPAYTGWPPQPSPQRIVALRGTWLEFSATVSKSLAEVILHRQNGPDVRATVTPDGYGFQIPGPASGLEPPNVDQSGQYWFELRDRDDGIVAQSDRWDIQAIGDQPPSVVLQQPESNLYLTAQAVLPVKILARDDLAIHTIGLVYNRTDHTEAGDVTIPLYVGPEKSPAAALDPAVAIGGATPAGESRTVDFSWSLAPLGLKPGVQIVASAVAADYMPQTGVSAPRRITIITREELEDRLAQRQTLIFSELSRILKMQQDARQQNATLERQIERTGALQRPDIESLRGEEIGQRQVRRSLVSPTEGVRSHIVALLGELTSNRVDNSEMRRKMQFLADETDRLDRDALPAAEQDLTAALKSSDDAEGATVGSSNRERSLLDKPAVAQTRARARRRRTSPGRNHRGARQNDRRSHRVEQLPRHRSRSGRPAPRSSRFGQ